MAIVSMSKIKLIALSYEKEKILNTLHKTRLVELKTSEEEEDTFTRADESKRENIKARLDSTSKCVEFILDQLDRAKKQPYYPKEIEGLENDVIVGYDEFMSAPGNEIELSYIIDKMDEYSKRLLDNRAKSVKLKNLITQLTPYVDVNIKFSEFADTAFTRTVFGLMPESNITAFKSFLAEYPLAEFTVYNHAPQSAVSLTAHRDNADELFAKLGELSFTKCPFDFNATASKKMGETYAALAKCDEIENNVNKKVCGKSNHLRNLKILADFYSFEMEKAVASEQFRCTDKTFTLEGYLPTDECVSVKNALYGASTAIFVEFSEPDENDTPPTLLKNNKLVSQAEFVTNMYSVPNYREFDPNGFVFIFFMIFFGLIMADIGYGILLIVLGFALSSRIKINNGTKKLMKIIAYGGFFTIIFGALFGSFFGFSLYSFLPDPSSGNRTDVLIILLGCLAMGLVQITFGYILKAVNAFRQKKIVDGIFDGLTWVVFNIGLVFAVFDFLTAYFKIPVPNGVQSFFQTMMMPGVIMVGVSLLVAMLTAGRKEKGFGKVTKGFGAAYGIINLLSDILSYARLFGLLLSGMIIAQQFNSMGVDMLSGGGIGYVFGPLIMIIGHTFNIAMGVLGAYIHDCRLQYIEFFSKFYTGEGELFTPLGSELNYIYLTK